MAKTVNIYDNYKEQIFKGGVAWTGSDIKMTGVSSSYTFSASHVYYSEVSAYNTGGTYSLTESIVVAGGFPYVDISHFTNYNHFENAPMKHLIFYKDTGTPWTSQLYFLITIDSAIDLDRMTLEPTNGLIGLKGI